VLHAGGALAAAADDGSRPATSTQQPALTDSESPHDTGPARSCADCRWQIRTSEDAVRRLACACRRVRAPRAQLADAGAVQGSTSACTSTAP
jgi:hypothetical protein